MLALLNQSFSFFTQGLIPSYIHLDIAGALGVLAFYFGCTRFLGDIFPRGPRLFNPIELDDIQIGNKFIFVAESYHA